jgi:uncharacterized protein YceH (UPF0502 family)
LVVRLSRQSGQKDARFAHLLSGEPVVEQSEEASESRAPRRAGDSDRVAKLEEQVQALTEQFESLSQQFETFRKQFE